MSNPKWTIGFVFLFVIFTVLSNIVEGVDPAIGLTKLDIFLRFSWVRLWPLAEDSYVKLFWQMFTFEYAFLDADPYRWFKYLLFLPISVGSVISLAVGVLKR